MEFQKVKAEQLRIANANANSNAGGGGTDNTSTGTDRNSSVNREYSDKIKSS